MTTIISLATRDCIVLGCDSLATMSKPMIDLEKVFNEYFNEDGTLRTDPNNKIILQDFGSLYQLSEWIPYNQIPTVTKIFSLEPAKVGLLFAGISGIGEKTIKNLLDQFTHQNNEFLDGEHTIAGISEKLLEFLGVAYQGTYGDLDERFQPYMEILISGYSTHETRPEIRRLQLPSPRNTDACAPGNFGLVYGGQYDVIQRVVYGLDEKSWLGLTKRKEELLDHYRVLIHESLKERGISLEDIIAVDHSNPDFQLFTPTVDISRLFPGFELFSEQAAIDFVDFLVDLMIKSQQFSNNLPTIGGAIHIALINKAEGFQWISEEHYLYRGLHVPKHKNHPKVTIWSGCF